MSILITQLIVSIKIKFLFSNYLKFTLLNLKNQKFTYLNLLLIFQISNNILEIAFYKLFYDLKCMIFSCVKLNSRIPTFTYNKLRFLTFLK